MPSLQKTRWQTQQMLLRSGVGHWTQSEREEPPIKYLVRWIVTDYEL